MYDKRDYKIASGICFYNDCKSLERTLNSLKDKVDYMICVDGKYKHYKADSELSDDGSRELIKSYDNTILIDKPNSYEIEKRQAYVNWCGPFPMTIDFLLIVDSDEYVLDYDQEVFEKELKYVKTGPYNQYNVFAVMLEINSGKYRHIAHEFVQGQPPQVTKGSDKQFAHSPRLWLRPYEMEYNMKHYYFRNKDPRSSLHYQETNAAVKIVAGMKLGHDHSLRTAEHLRRRHGYQKWLVNFEQKKLDDIVRKTKINPQIEDYDKIDNAN